MPDTFRRYLREKGTFTDEEVDVIESLARVRMVKRKQFILRAGEVCHYHTFISKGCMKLYRLGERRAHYQVRHRGLVDKRSAKPFVRRTVGQLYRRVRGYGCPAMDKCGVRALAQRGTGVRRVVQAADL